MTEKERKKQIKEYSDLIKWRLNRCEELSLALKYVLNGNTLFEDKYSPINAVLECIEEQVSCIKADKDYYEHLLSE